MKFDKKKNDAFLYSIIMGVKMWDKDEGWVGVAWGCYSVM